MTKIVKFLIVVLLINYGCSSDSTNTEELIEEPISLNKINLKISDQPPTHSIRNLSASLCCNERLTISFDHWVDTGDGLGNGGSAFNVSLTREGDLLGLYYKDYTHPNNEFHSPFFTPTTTLSVSEFLFAENQSLHLKLSGKLFKPSYDFNAEPEFITIEADIEIKEFNDCSCGSFMSYIKANNNLSFYNISRSVQGNEINYFANSNDGYQVEFNNFNEYFRDMPLGEVHSFDENATSERIDLRKFIGIPRAFSTSILPQEWLKYETAGNFEIIERRQINGEIISKIRFNLTAKENGVLVHEFNNVVFETQL